MHGDLRQRGHQGPCIVVARQKGNHQITVPEDLNEPILREKAMEKAMGKAMENPWENHGKSHGLLHKVGPPFTIAFSWGSHNSDNYMVYGTQITRVFMGFINQQTSLGGPHCRQTSMSEPFLGQVSLSQNAKDTLTC